MKQYIVDAFTDEPFSGNPAAVCVMDKWMTDEDMMKLARENNLSETAFIVKETEGYRLRWFTPGTEVDLCGHATLASAFVILEHFEKTDRVEFITRSGRLTVTRRDGLYEMDFPVYDYEEIPVTDDMEKAYGQRPVKVLLGTDLVCVFESEEQVREMTPDQTLLAKLDGRIQNATARGSEADCVSRSFAPKLAIAEDPVCGSAHCQIANFWSAELGKKKIHAYQASERGGHLFCEIGEEGRMTISGKACLVAVSEVVAFD